MQATLRLEGKYNIISIDLDGELNGTRRASVVDANNCANIFIRSAIVWPDVPARRLNRILQANRVGSFDFRAGSAASYCSNILLNFQKIIPKITKSETFNPI